MEAFIFSVCFSTPTSNSRTSSHEIWHLSFWISTMALYWLLMQRSSVLLTSWLHIHCTLYLGVSCILFPCPYFSLSFPGSPWPFVFSSCFHFFLPFPSSLPPTTVSLHFPRIIIYSHLATYWEDSCWISEQKNEGWIAFLSLLSVFASFFYSIIFLIPDIFLWFLLRPCLLSPSSHFLLFLTYTSLILISLLFWLLRFSHTRKP